MNNSYTYGCDELFDAIIKAKTHPTDDFNNIISLDCSGNNLKNIILPINLQMLDCSNNNIERLYLPNTLITLNCSNNKKPIFTRKFIRIKMYK